MSAVRREQTPGTAWHAALCKPRQEAIAERNLVDQGYEVFLPRLATQRRQRGKWAAVVEPLFPRYLFLATTSHRQSLAPVRSTPGVTTLVRFGVEPATIPAAIVEELRATHDATMNAWVYRPTFKPGMQVRVATTGAAWMNAIFEAEHGEDRVVVLLEMLGKVNRVTVSRDWILPAQ